MRFFVAFLYVTKVFSVVSLFCRCITFAKRAIYAVDQWHWLRYRWNDEWSWWIAWPWSRHFLKDMFFIGVSALKIPGDQLFEIHFWMKSYLCFFSLLNEINRGCEKILPVSGLFLSSLKFFRMTDFTAWNGILSLFSFCDVCNTDCRSICWARWWPPWTTEAR